MEKVRIGIIGTGMGTGTVNHSHMDGYRQDVKKPALEPGLALSDCGKECDGSLTATDHSILTELFEIAY